MTTVDYITELFCRVDDKIDDNKHKQAKLYPSSGYLGVDVCSQKMWTTRLLAMVDQRLSSSVP